MNDPYRVLGLTSDASDDDVKKAYRRLAKKYHPDMNPGDETAAKKMNEVNEAYDLIKNPQKAQPTYGQRSANNPYGSAAYGANDPFAAWYEAQQRAQDEYERTTPSEIRAAKHFISVGRYGDALNALSGMKDADRTAQWYHLSALAHSGLGNRMMALDHARRAVQMEPTNVQYRQTLEQLEQTGSAYQTNRRTYTAGTMDVGKLCMSACLCYLCSGGCCL